MASQSTAKVDEKSNRNMGLKKSHLLYRDTCAEDLLSENYVSISYDTKKIVE